MEMPKGIQFLELTPEKVKSLWEKLNVIEGLFDDYSKGNFQVFLSALQDRNSVWLERTDGNGLLYLTQVRPGLSAQGHVVFWDKRLRGREDFTLETLLWLMDMLKLQKVNVWLPTYAKAAIAFTKRVGFKFEGHIRNWSYSKGKLFDIDAFGITREEAENEWFHGIGDERVRRTVHGSSNGLVQESESTTDGDTGDTNEQPVNATDATEHREVRS